MNSKSNNLLLTLKRSGVLNIRDFCTVIHGLLISMIVLVFLLKPVNSLSQTGLIEYTTESSLVDDDSSRVFILRSLADQSDVSALNSLVDLASQDSQEAALALYFLALWSNTPAQLQTLNPQAFIDGTNRGNIGSVLVFPEAKIRSCQAFSGL